jgi:myo-inositol catabolism protein IolC
VRDRLFVLAFDHRNSLMTSFFGVEGAPGPEDVERARLAKQLTWEGMRRALETDVVPRERAGVLVDTTYGLDVIRAAQAEGVPVAMPIEASGREELAFEDGGWKQRIAELRPTWVKVLLRYNPGGEANMNRQQRSKLREVRQRSRDTGLGFMLELLVPPTPAQLESVGGDPSRYDLEIRPDLTVQAIGELRLDEIGADVWKLEGLDARADCVRVADAAGAPCLVLGRGADRDAVVRWLTTAADVPGYIGFAIGRSIWWEAWRAFFATDGAADAREVAVTAIAERYADYVRVYEAAATGG